MQVLINGTDITDYIAFGGLKWSRNDVDDPDTGRTMDGTMQRGRVATKIRLDITCRMLNSTEISTLLNLIQPEFVTVVYDDPMYGTVTKIMYANNNPATYQILYENGEEYWSGVTFPLIER